MNTVIEKPMPDGIHALTKVISDFPLTNQDTYRLKVAKKALAKKCHEDLEKHRESVQGSDRLL